MVDMREINKTKNNEPGIMVDLAQFADDWGLSKEPLTKWNRPLLEQWISEHPK